MSGASPDRAVSPVASEATAHLELVLPAAHDWSVDVTGPGSDLAWLSEFLCPPFDRRRRPPAAAAKVDLVVDGERHAALLARHGWQSAPRRAVFALDAGALEMPVLAGADGSHTVLDDDFRVVYRLSEAATLAELVSATPNVRVRTALLRVLREMLMGRIFAAGWPLLHASAIELDGRAVVFLGPTGAGKTSLLLHALGIPRARLLANDRVAVRDGDGGLVAFPVPTIVTLRESGLAFFPAVARRLAASRFTHRLSLAECAAPDAPLPRAWRNGKFGLTPAQLAVLLEVDRAGSATPAAVVLPRHTGERGGVRLRRLDGEEARGTLRETQLAGGAWMVATALFRPPEVDQAAALARRDERLDRLAATLPIHIAELGLDAYAGGDFQRQLAELAETAG